MNGYSSYSDDYYINVNLGTEMDLPQQRETVLHYFEQVQRRFPKMQNFYTRERTEFVLEEGKDQGTYRWASIESRRVNSGWVNPTSIDEAFEQHRTILDLAPYTLSLSPLDCESLSLVFGFDFTFRGNHSALLTEALGIAPAFEPMLSIPGATLLGNEPSMLIALDDECKTQIRVSFEPRSTPYNVRTGEYSEEQLSVYLTVRRFDSLSAGETYVSEFDRLGKISRDFVDSYLIENVLRPLQQTIAMQ